MQCAHKLGEQVEELSGMRNDRLRQLEKLRTDEERLCEMLSAMPCDVSAGRVPSTHQLAQIQEHILRLEREKV